MLRYKKALSNNLKVDYTDLNFCSYCSLLHYRVFNSHMIGHNEDYPYYGTFSKLGYGI